MSSIAFLGLGAMGLPIARNLLQAGHSLSVYNRSRDKTQPLEALGARVARSPADAVKQSEFVFTMLADDQALWQVAQGADGFLDAMVSGAIHLSLSTVLPATAREMASNHEANGVHYVAAPVFGRPEAAAAAKLWICLSGAPQARARVLPLLAAISQGCQEFGNDPGAANLVKLCGNFMIAAATESMAEAFTLGAKNGLDPSQLAEFFGSTLFNCGVYQNYGRLIANQEFEPAGFKMALGYKDMRLVDDVARDSLTPMPLGHLLLERMMAGVSNCRGNLDWTAITLDVMAQAGLKARD